MPKVATRIVVERSNPAKASRELWKGLVKFNRQQAGPLKYSRTVLSVRDGKGRLLGGLILQSYWRESYIELLWLSARARRAGFGRRLIEEAERRARRRGSRLIHLKTYSFRASTPLIATSSKAFGQAASRARKPNVSGQSSTGSARTRLAPAATVALIGESASGSIGSSIDWSAISTGRSKTEVRGMSQAPKAPGGRSACAWRSCRRRAVRGMRSRRSPPRRACASAGPCRCCPSAWRATRRDFLPFQ